jgi:hypothetical protein
MVAVLINVVTKCYNSEELAAKVDGGPVDDNQVTHAGSLNIPGTRYDREPIAMQLPIAKTTFLVEYDILTACSTLAIRKQRCNIQALVCFIQCIIITVEFILPFLRHILSVVNEIILGVFELPILQMVVWTYGRIYCKRLAYDTFATGCIQ